MSWLLVAAWGGALLLAVVILGFCGYEISWKARRLRRDVARLQGQLDQLAALSTTLDAARGRAVAAGTR